MRSLALNLDTVIIGHMEESTNSGEKPTEAQSPVNLRFGEMYEPGQMLGGKYKVVSVLGAGGMGYVYRVQQVFLHKDFALKTLNNLGTSDVSMRRFQLEAKTATLLNHPNLVQVHDFGLLDDERPFLVMDFIDGITLADHLKLHGAMEVEEACKLFAQVCLGLAYAHEQHVVHRDLKPGNIMLVKGAARTEGCVKVVDFGIAKIISGDGGEAQSLTRTGEIFGSPLYMSPEQCSSDLVDNRSDVYSLGCVLFEALTGAPPHLGNTALSTMMLHQQAQASTLKEASLGKEFPLALEQVVARMLRKSPAERYQNLSTAAHDLSAICRGSISQLIPTVSPSSARPAPRVVSMSAAKFCLVLAVTAATAAVVSSSLTCLLMPKPAALTKGQQDQEVHRNEDTPAFDIPAGSVDLAMTKRAPLDDSLVDMHFDFPKAYSVGSLLGFRIVDTYGPEKDARGSVDVRVPDGLGVMLYLNQACLNDPEKLKHFSAKGISGLKICDSTHKQLISGTKVLKILKIAQAWSDLRCVCLCPSGVTNHDVVDALCELKGLRTLLVGSIDDPEDFASRPLLMQLASFICTKNFDASSILKHLAQSRNLQSLGLWIDSVPAAQIMELQQCPRLENLVVFSAHRSIGSNIVEAITHLKNLKTVMFDNIKLASAQVEMLRLQCPSVSHIVVLGHLYTPQEEETLKQIDERIVFK